MSPSATFCRGAHVTSLESAFVVFSDSASESFKLQKHNDQCQRFPKTTLETYANTNRICIGIRHSLGFWGLVLGLM